MAKLVINSDTSLQSVIGELREMYREHRYVKVTAKAGKSRSLDQNAISHAWYEQIARELKEDDALGWKCYCKLHHGVPLLRAENDEFRAGYDGTLKCLTYEQKLLAMKMLPVSSLMTKQQLSRYLESIQADFHRRGVVLEFPADGAQ